VPAYRSQITFGSVCSGIEAASVAWHPIGWRADWFAEIEKFPSAVLAHHWPDVPNHGDMLLLPDMVARGEIPAPDVLVGGTPCQAFSVAGKRESLVDTHATLDANNGPRRHNGVIVPQVVHGTQDPITVDDCALPLGRNAGQENAVFSFDLAQITCATNRSRVDVAMPSSTISKGSNMHVAHHAIRRLTPRECERLQGFPDDQTLIPLPMVGRQTRQRYSSDSARYKAIGNSMAVPVMRWIGSRIARQITEVAA
jgi:site-specific DNA-cytosine methylase